MGGASSRATNCHIPAGRSPPGARMEWTAVTAFFGTAARKTRRATEPWHRPLDRLRLPNEMRRLTSSGSSRAP